MGEALDDGGRDDRRIGSVTPPSLERRVAGTEVLAADLEVSSFRLQELLTATPYNRMVVSMHIALDHDRIFGALGDATRRDIVRRAIDGKEGVAELAAHYPMSFAAVQKHVAVLERAGLVSKHRIGRRKVVRTNLEGLRVARRLLDGYEELWRERVERMNQLISEPPKEADR
jgi:DNA-binding transcriptional ArsR family regulator